MAISKETKKKLKKIYVSGKIPKFKKIAKPPYIVQDLFSEHEKMFDKSGLKGAKEYALKRLADTGKSTAIIKRFYILS